MESAGLAVEGAGRYSPSDSDLASLLAEEEAIGRLGITTEPLTSFKEGVGRGDA